MGEHWGSISGCGLILTIWLMVIDGFKTAYVQGAESVPWVLSPECVDILNKSLSPPPSYGTPGFSMLNVKRSIAAHAKAVRTRVTQLNDQPIYDYITLTAFVLSSAVYSWVYLTFMPRKLMWGSLWLGLTIVMSNVFHSCRLEVISLNCIF